MRELEEEIRAVEAREIESLQRSIEDFEARQPPARPQAQSWLPRWLESSSKSSSDGHETALMADAAVLRRVGCAVCAGRAVYGRKSVHAGRVGRRARRSGSDYLAMHGLASHVA